jgi:hypothetical protein
VFNIYKEERKFKSGVRETYMHARIATTVKKRGHEQVVRSSWREKIGLMVQFENFYTKWGIGVSQNPARRMLCNK